MSAWPLWVCSRCGFETAWPDLELNRRWPEYCAACEVRDTMAELQGKPQRYRLFFKLLGLPTMERNARRHWTVRSSETQGWRSAVAFAVLGRTPPEPLERAQVRLRRHSEREPDPTNLLEGFKAIEDAIVKAGLLVDDKSRHYAQRGPIATWAWAPQGAGFVSVLIEDATLEGVTDGRTKEPEALADPHRSRDRERGKARRRPGSARDPRRDR